MQELLDIGVEEFQIVGGGVLRFHPGDPNLFARFLRAEEEIQALEKTAGQGVQDSAQVLAQMEAADRKIKDILNGVFGSGNDFHKALGGVNLLAVDAKGQSLAAKLFGALETVLTEGAKRFAKQQAEKLIVDNG
jgi:hypothetical protein